MSRPGTRSWRDSNIRPTVVLPEWENPTCQRLSIETTLDSGLSRAGRKNFPHTCGAPSRSMFDPLSQRSAILGTLQRISRRWSPSPELSKVGPSVIEIPPKDTVSSRTKRNPRWPTLLPSFRERRGIRSTSGSSIFLAQDTEEQIYIRLICLRSNLRSFSF